MACFLFLFILTTTVSTSGQTQTYIVHMDSTAMPKAYSGLQSWYLSTLEALSTSTSDSPVSDRLIYTYTHGFNGFSARLSPAELKALKHYPGYLSSTRDSRVTVDTTHTYRFLGLNSHPGGAWAMSNCGEGMIIGVVDTGVWPESHSFADHGMPEVPSRWRGKCEHLRCNKKLIGARYFNKGVVAAYPNLTIVNSPRDTEGHGTHTSSTAAGSSVDGASYLNYAPGTARGMAPRARVAMYKALWGQVSQISDVIAAIDQAIMDGVDVLSMSFGQDLELYENPIAIASFAAMEKGIFVSTSAGNDGPALGNLHNGIPWVLTVAASTVDRDFNGVLTLGDGRSITGKSLFPGNNSTQTPIVFAANECLDLEQLIKIGQHKIVVCDEMSFALTQQVQTVAQANVAGAAFIAKDIASVEFVTVTSFTVTSFPAVFLSFKDGQAVKHYLNTNPQEAKATIRFQVTTLGIKPAPAVAIYSSRGPSPNCPHVLKPDLTAPGDRILAAWPNNVPVGFIGSNKIYSDFNLISGTSMACPHAAGVAALLKAAHPKWSPAAIRSAMMTTAYSLDNTNTPIRDAGVNYQAATPLAMGSGHLNPNKALHPGLVYDASAQDYVNLLCGLNYTTKQIRTITKLIPNCSNPSLDLNYPGFIFIVESNTSSAREFHRTVTNVGIGASTYTATLSPMQGFKVAVSPEKLVFRKTYEKQRYKLSLSILKTDFSVVSGTLVWADEGGHVVKSPIVAVKHD